jgi:hypothetical protein
MMNKERIYRLLGDRDWMLEINPANSLDLANKWIFPQWLSDPGEDWISTGFSWGEPEKAFLQNEPEKAISRYIIAA